MCFPHLEGSQVSVQVWGSTVLGHVSLFGRLIVLLLLRQPALSNLQDQTLVEKQQGNSQSFTALKKKPIEELSWCVYLQVMPAAGGHLFPVWKEVVYEQCTQIMAVTSQSTGQECFFCNLE